VNEAFFSEEGLHLDWLPELRGVRFVRGSRRGGPSRNVNTVLLTYVLPHPRTAGCGEVAGGAVDCVLVLAAHKHPVRRKVSKPIVVATVVLLSSLSYIHTVCARMPPVRILVRRGELANQRIARMPR
jgi:hypothetical protein